LQTFEEHGKLKHPLGRWIAPLHQTWHHFLDIITGVVYESSHLVQKQYQPLLSRQYLRSGQWYDIDCSQSYTELPQGLVPASVIRSSLPDDSLFQVRASPNCIPLVQPSMTFLKDRQFYNSLVPIQDDIPYADLMNDGSIHINVGGTVSGDGMSSSSTWSFHSIVVTYSSGHTQVDLCTRYRAELRGLLTALYILYKAEKTQFPANPPTVTLQCGHKKVVKEAFRSTPIG